METTINCHHKCNDSFLLAFARVLAFPSHPSKLQLQCPTRQQLICGGERALLCWCVFCCCSPCNSPVASSSYLQHVQCAIKPGVIGQCHTGHWKHPPPLIHSHFSAPPNTSKTKQQSYSCLPYIPPYIRLPDLWIHGGSSPCLHDSSFLTPQRFSPIFPQYLIKKSLVQAPQRCLLWQTTLLTKMIGMNESLHRHDSQHIIRKMSMGCLIISVGALAWKHPHNLCLYHPSPLWVRPWRHYSSPPAHCRAIFRGTLWAYSHDICGGEKMTHDRKCCFYPLCTTLGFTTN